MGERLAQELAQLQTRRFASALASLGPGADHAAKRFLLAMIDPQDRLRVEELIGEDVADSPMRK